ncbi:hypothetical protein UO65_2188 [Actinokineospora spheciospongiae]|uniref:Uncharacterized protein n=1 Tax=Actinokineospora spheciospongiae TaxID=909613 RepID=W7J0P2_9PSEU|nr:DUF4173 domain-containing protein [Actinokineospora spheciospongiae]EWC62501.1 hypothetical protein UO65_2188 [Actinokineospora spheciospongiae]
MPGPTPTDPSPAAASAATAAQAPPTQPPTAQPVLTRPWPPPGSWAAEHWVRRSPAASRTVLLLVGAVAAVGASVLPLDRPGVGWTVAALGVATALLTAGGRVRADWRWLLLGAALMTVPTLRAAHWLTALCVLGACVAVALSVTGGRTVRELVFGVVVLWAGAVRALPWASAGLRALRRGGSRVRVLRTVALGLLVLVVFGSLLASADAAFADLFEALIPQLDLAAGVRWVWVFAVLGLVVLGGCYLLDSPAGLPEPASGPAGRRAAVVEWAGPVGVLVLLFTGFVAVQLRVLFGGGEHVLRTTGLTYAEYARGGFWQLLVVTVLTLAVVGIAARVAPRDTAVERGWLRALLGGLVALTLVIVASALVRMWTYQQTYGFTVLRLQVEVVELWLGLVCLLVLVAGARLRAGWLPGAVLVSALLAVFGVGLLDPERFVAERNVARYAETGNLDLVYLSRLSPDAVPALAELPGYQRACVLNGHREALSASYGPAETATGWNLGRARAREVLAGTDPASFPHCRPAR